MTTFPETERRLRQRACATVSTDADVASTSEKSLDQLPDDIHLYKDLRDSIATLDLHEDDVDAADSLEGVWRFLPGPVRTFVRALSPRLRGLLLCNLLVLVVATNWVSAHGFGHAWSPRVCPSICVAALNV